MKLPPCWLGMNQAFEHLSRTIEALYRTVLEPAAWSEVLAELAGLDEADRDWLVDLYVHPRAPLLPPTSMAEAELLQRLAVHFQRAGALRARRLHLRHDLDLTTEALEHADFGVMVLDADARVLLVNAVARQILDARGGFEPDAGRPISLPLELRGPLRRALTAAVDHARQGVNERHLAFGAEAQALDLRLIPIRGATPLRPPLPETSATLVLLDTPSRPDRLDPGHLESIYGLTPGEAHVAARVAVGQSVDEIAEALERSPQTLRTHIKRVYMKVGVSSRAELVIRLLRGAGSLT